MRGVWHGMLLINCLLFLILIDAYVAGVVSVYYPLMVIGSGVLCVWAAETQKGDDKDDPDNSKR